MDHFGIKWFMTLFMGKTTYATKHEFHIGCVDCCNTVGWWWTLQKVFSGLQKSVNILLAVLMLLLFSKWETKFFRVNILSTDQVGMMVKSQKKIKKSIRQMEIWIMSIFVVTNADKFFALANLNLFLAIFILMSTYLISIYVFWMIYSFRCCHLLPLELFHWFLSTMIVQCWARWLLKMVVGAVTLVPPLNSCLMGILIFLHTFLAFKSR